MRRWIAILVLTLLPLQFSWAAIAVYGGHESGQHAEHLGHHHQHADAGHANLDPDSGVSGSGCHHCDCTFCACLPAPVSGLTSRRVGSRPAPPVDGIVRTLVQHPPERPQWPRA